MEQRIDLSYTVRYLCQSYVKSMTVNPETVRQMEEMGISKQDAVQALKLTDGDVERALNYIFQGPEALIPPKIERPGHATSLETEVNYAAISDEQMLAQTLQPYKESNNSAHSFHSGYGARHIEDVSQQLPSYHVPLHRNEAHSSPSSSQEIQEISSGEEDDQEPQYTSVYDNIYRYHRTGDSLPVLMPVKSGFLESYLNPVLTIFHQVPGLRKIVYQYAFETLGFHPRWFKGETILIPEDVISVKQNNKTVDLSFLLEVQRLFAFLDGDSERSFTSVESFIKAFPKEAKQKFQDIDTLHEAYEVFVDSLVHQLKQVGVKSPGQFFQNVATDVESGESRSFSVFNIEADDINKDLYHTIHSVLWHGDFESNQYIASLADIVTFTFEASYQHKYSTHHLLITEEFYPQIYTVGFKDIVKDFVSKRSELERERREIAADLMKIRVHNGKQVSHALSHSIEFLSNELEQTENDSLKKAVEDLQLIQEQATQRKHELTERQNNITEAKKEFNPYNVEALLAQSPKELEPYLLTGIIFSPTKFAFAKKSNSLVDDSNSLTWYLVRYKPDDLDDFEIEEVPFPSLQELTYKKTGLNFQSAIVLTYVLKSKFLEEVQLEIPQSVRDFIKKDNEELLKSLELILSSSEDEPDSDENMDYDSESQKDELQEPDLIQLNEVDGKLKQR